MPQMWELPRLQPEDANTDKSPLFTLRHAIMQTNYRVRIFEMAKASGPRGWTGNYGGCWIEVAELPGLPLTGLARKIFLRLGLL
jgi:hypothetical protein